MLQGALRTARRAGYPEAHALHPNDEMLSRGQVAHHLERWCVLLAHAATLQRLGQCPEEGIIPKREYDGLGYAALICTAGRTSRSRRESVCGVGTNAKHSHSRSLSGGSHRVSGVSCGAGKWAGGTMLCWSQSCAVGRATDS